MPISLSALDKLAVASSSVAFHALVQVAGMAVGLLVISAIRSTLNELSSFRYSWRLLLAAVTFCACGLALELTVIQAIPLRFVSIIKRVCELSLAVIIGRYIFHETINTRKLVGIGLMAIGIVIILI